MHEKIDGDPLAERCEIVTFEVSGLRRRPQLHRCKADKAQSALTSVLFSTEAPAPQSEQDAKLNCEILLSLG
jgi:hypothetical protein